MCSLGDLSGQIQTITNPTSETSLTVTGGGYAAISVFSSDIANKWSRIIISGSQTYDAANDGEHGELLIYVGDPSNIAGSTNLISTDYTNPGSSPYYNPFVWEMDLFWDTVVDKLYYRLSTGSGAANPFSGYTLGNGGTSAASLGSLNVLTFFLTAIFDNNHVANSITVNTFKIFVR